MLSTYMGVHSKATNMMFYKYYISGRKALAEACAQLFFVSLPGLSSFQCSKDKNHIGGRRVALDYHVKREKVLCWEDHPSQEQELPGRMWNVREY